jgi:hypothetical protein
MLQGLQTSEVLQRAMLAGRAERRARADARPPHGRCALLACLHQLICARFPSAGRRQADCGGPRLLARRRWWPLPPGGCLLPVLCLTLTNSRGAPPLCLAAAAPSMAGYPPPAADYPPPPPSGAPPPGYPAAGVPVGANGTNEKGYPYGECIGLI